MKSGSVSIRFFGGFVIRHCLPCFTSVNFSSAICVPWLPCCAPTYWPVPLNDAWTAPETSTVALFPSALMAASRFTLT